MRYNPWCGQIGKLDDIISKLSENHKIAYTEFKLWQLKEFLNR